MELGDAGGEPASARVDDQEHRVSARVVWQWVQGVIDLKIAVRREGHSRTREGGGAAGSGGRFAKELGLDHLVAGRPNHVGASEQQAVSVDMDMPISSVHFGVKVRDHPRGGARLDAADDVGDHRVRRACLNLRDVDSYTTIKVDLAVGHGDERNESEEKKGKDQGFHCNN